MSLRANYISNAAGYVGKLTTTLGQTLSLHLKEVMSRRQIRATLPALTFIIVQLLLQSCIQIFLLFFQSA